MPSRSRGFGSCRSIASSRCCRLIGARSPRGSGRSSPDASMKRWGGATSRSCRSAPSRRSRWNGSSRRRWCRGKGSGSRYRRCSRNCAAVCVGASEAWCGFGSRPNASIAASRRSSSRSVLPIVGRGISRRFLNRSSIDSMRASASSGSRFGSFAAVACGIARRGWASIGSTNRRRRVHAIGSRQGEGRSSRTRPRANSSMPWPPDSASVRSSRRTRSSRICRKRQDGARRICKAECRRSTGASRRGRRACRIRPSRCSSSGMRLRSRCTPMRHRPMLRPADRRSCRRP